LSSILVLEAKGYEVKLLKLRRLLRLYQKI